MTDILQTTDVLHFLWVDDVDKQIPDVIYKFTHIVFGVSSSPFLLNAMIRHHIRNMLRCILSLLGPSLDPFTLTM